MATKPTTPKSAALKVSGSKAVATKKVTGGAVVDMAAIRAKLQQEIADLANKTAPPGGDVIQITQAKEFKLPDGTKSQGPLELVIVDFNSQNKFYEGAYDPNNISPPACFAIGETPSALVPSKASPVPQSSNCSGCPMNQFGSAGAGKACKNTRVLAVLPPDADADTPMWVLNVSPTALKAFDAYVNSVARQFQMPPVGVVTEVSFDPNTDYPSLRFAAIGPNEQIGNHYERKEEAKKRLTQEPDVTSYEAPKKTAARKTAGARR